MHRYVCLSGTMAQAGQCEGIRKQVVSALFPHSSLPLPTSHCSRRTLLHKNTQQYKVFDEIPRDE